MSDSLQHNIETLISDADMVYSSLKQSYFAATPTLTNHYNIFDCNQNYTTATHFHEANISETHHTQTQTPTQQHLFYPDSHLNTYLITDESSTNTTISNNNNNNNNNRNSIKQPPNVIEPLPQLTISTNFNLPPSSPIFLNNITPTFTNYDPQIQMKTFLDVERDMR